ncbi:MAG TPA: hypothetical protein VGM73_13730 [Candidatus Didemnitutus sp.]|jgi:3-oxoacyl-(acyl-carrier-protein) synthase
MTAPVDNFPLGIEACDCLTPWGDAEATVTALLEERRALEMRPVLGRDGGDLVPLAVIGTMDETLPARWLPEIRRMARGVPAGPWGTARAPVIVTSSNFGVGSHYAFARDHDPRHLTYGTPYAAVEAVRRELGWGRQVHVFSHACVTAHLGLAHAARLVQAGLAERVLVFSFDFISPFVAGGFHSLKILNRGMPAPYACRETGSIGLGDGAAFAVVSRASTPARIVAHAFHNEMFHFTGNQADGAGFRIGAAAMAGAARGRRVWIKGHGTGTLEAGRLEAEAFAAHFPGAPLVSWKGSLGHTLGSCGLVELAITLAALRRRRVPGTVGGAAPAFTGEVALHSFDPTGFDAAVLASNAFGGAHAALLLEFTA